MNIRQFGLGFFKLCEYLLIRKKKVLCAWIKLIQLKYMNEIKKIIDHYKNKNNAN